MLWMVSDCCWMVNICSLMKSMTKDGDPTGIPSRRNPSVNSTGVDSEGFSLLDLVEKVAIASVMSVARPGLVFEIVEMGDVPFHDDHQMMMEVTRKKECLA